MNFPIVSLTMSLFFACQGDNMERYRVLNKEYESQNFAGDVFTYFDTFGKLPENNDSLLIEIKKAMILTGIESYLDYRLDPFRNNETYYYSRIEGENGAVGFCILSSGPDGEVNTENPVRLETLKYHIVHYNKDILVSVYLLESDGNWEFKELPYPLGI